LISKYIYIFKYIQFICWVINILNIHVDYVANYLIVVDFQKEFEWIVYVTVSIIAKNIDKSFVLK